jgi:hypothetical protein
LAPRRENADDVQHDVGGNGENNASENSGEYCADAF